MSGADTSTTKGTAVATHVVVHRRRQRLGLSLITLVSCLLLPVLDSDWKLIRVVAVLLVTRIIVACFCVTENRRRPVSLRTGASTARAQRDAARKRFQVCQRGLALLRASALLLINETNSYYTSVFHTLRRVCGCPC